jgi:hypothetical protein
MFILKMAEHSLEPDHRQIVEVWNGNVFMGAIYPTDTGIKVVSKYIADNPEAAIKVDRSKLPPIPAILINLI